MILFHFRCSAFGVHYYDCVIRGGSSFEVQHTCQVGVRCPEISARFGHVVSDEVKAAWKEFCDGELAKFSEWLRQHPETIPFIKPELLPEEFKRKATA